MIFDKAMVHPTENNTLMWHYTGTTKAGVLITCEVVAKQETIHSLTSSMPIDYGVITENDARSCLKRYLEINNISLNANDARFLHASAMVDTPEGTQRDMVQTFYLQLENGGGTFSGNIRIVDGELHVVEVFAKSLVDGEEVPYILSDDIPLLIPRWKSK